MELYEKLYQLRKKSGFTQSELAEKLGISRTDTIMKGIGLVEKELKKEEKYTNSLKVVV